MATDIEKLLTLIHGEFILFKRDMGKQIASLVDALKVKQTINVTHEVRIPDITVPEPKVTVNVPEIKLPKFQIPEIKIPAIKIPTINVPAPEVTVNVPERKEELALLKQIVKLLMEMKPYNVWDDVAKKTPLPVILVNEKTEYYTAGGGGSVSMIGGGSVGGRPMNNTVFGSSSLVVSTAGTPVQFPDQGCAEVTITAMETNTDVVTVGGHNVKGAKASRIGQPLEPLQSYTIAIDNLENIFLDSVEDGEGVTFTYLS